MKWVWGKLKGPTKQHLWLQPGIDTVPGDRKRSACNYALCDEYGWSAHSVAKKCALCEKLLADGALTNS